MFLQEHRGCMNAYGDLECNIIEMELLEDYEDESAYCAWPKCN